MIQLTDEQLETVEAELSKPAEDVWVVDWNGPKQATLLRLYPRHNRAVIEFNGALELVEAKKVFPTEQAAYTAAWLEKMDAAHGHMSLANVYRDRANKLRTEGER